RSDDVDVESHRLSDAFEVLQRLAIRGWQRIVGIEQDGQVVTTRAAALARAPRLAQVGFQRIDEGGALFAFQLRDVARAHAAQRPAALAAELDAQDGAGEGIEYLPADLGEPRVRLASEEQQDLEFRRVLAAQRLLQALAEILR